MFALATLGIASAQKYCIIDSEKVFKSLDEYNKAMTQLDELVHIGSPLLKYVKSTDPNGPVDRKTCCIG